eukprot:XP_020393563.1 zinc finger BED domain-containing protein RICESLEEPER 1-like [Zea mays]
MSTPNENSNTQFQPPSSQASVEGGSGLPENVITVEQDGDEDDEVEVEENGRKRKLKSAVWSEFKRVKVGDVWKAKCNYCSKKLSGVTKNGTSHLKAHLETCIYRKRNPTDKVQSSLRFTSSSEQGQVSVEKYVFDQDVARKALAEMVVLHEYPLSIVDHVGFRRFIYVPSPHIVEALSDVLMKCLMDWHIDKNISTLTLDNCSTNDALITLMNRKLRGKKPLLGGKLLHMRCSAHILNLIVIDGLEVMGSGIEKIRNSVAFWYATPKRHERFQEIAAQVNVECNKKLSLDCKTRWNSTYIMLSVAICYKEAFDRLAECERAYDFSPSEDEWKFASEVCDRLKLFYEITELFSGTQYVTANDFFPKICAIRGHMSKWLECDDELIKSMSSRMITKFDKYWTDIHGLMAIAVVLDPRYKFGMLKACYTRLFGAQSRAMLEIENVRKLFDELIKEYNNKCIKPVTSGGQNASSSCVSNASTYTDELFSAMEEELDDMCSDEEKAKSELDLYVDEGRIPKSKDFDILGYWKISGIRVRF